MSIHRLRRRSLTSVVNALAGHRCIQSTSELRASRFRTRYGLRYGLLYDV
jgi:hypothetical protein